MHSLKRISILFCLIFGYLMFCFPAKGQTPDCYLPFTLKAVSSGTVYSSNVSAGCSNWYVFYQSTGFSALSLQFETAPGTSSSGPGSFTAATAATGSNPSTNIVSGIATFAITPGFYRMNVTAVTGTGEISGGIIGYRTSKAAGGPPTGAAGGDLSGTYPNPTVAKVNGATVPASASCTGTNSSHQIISVSCGGPPTGSASGDLGSTYPNPTVVNLSNVSNASLPNAGLVNPSTTVNGTTCTLGSTCSPSTAPTGSAGGDLSGTYPNPGVAKVNGGSVPASAGCVGTNSSGQLISVTCGTNSGGGITVYSGSAVTVTASTYYFPIGGGAIPSATETNVDVEAPSAATISNFYVQMSVALGTGNSGVFTWRKAGSSQTLTCTISGASATSCNDLTHSFNVAQGDLIDVQLVTTGTIVVTPNIIMAVQFGTTGSVTCTQVSSMCLISDQLLVSPTATVTFSSIPNTYKHLIVYVTAACSTAAVAEDVYMQANGDTSANYSRQYIQGNLTNVTSGQTLSSTNPGIIAVPCSTGFTNGGSAAEIFIPNYGGTTFLKGATSKLSSFGGSAQNSFVSLQISWYWNSTTAITQLVFGQSAGGGNFIAGSRFTLYGLN